MLTLFCFVIQEAKEKDPKWQDTSLVHFISDDESNPVKVKSSLLAYFVER